MPPLTTSPVTEVDLFGEKIPIKYGFRAYQEMGLNPFDPKSIEEFASQQADCRTLASHIRAGMLHLYYGRTAARKGQDPPTIEEVMDELDPFNYVDIWMRVLQAMGVGKDQPEAQKAADPPKA